MKNFMRFLIVAFTGLLLTGCMEVENLITVKADGSGTIRQTVLMDIEFIEMMEDMISGSSGDSPSLLNLDQLKAAALKMGDGVSFVDAVEHENATSEGYIVTYAFTDINNLTIEQHPAMNPPFQEKNNEPLDPLSFVFTRDDLNNLSTLTMKFSGDDSVKRCDEDITQLEPRHEDEGTKLMDEWLRKMRIAIVVEFEGNVVDTNATYLEDNRVTIMDMLIGELMADENIYNHLSSATDKSGKSLEHAKQHMRDIPGIKIDMNEEIVVKFK